MEEVLLGRSSEGRARKTRRKGPVQVGRHSAQGHERWEQSPGERGCASRSLGHACCCCWLTRHRVERFLRCSLE
ncbi:hypothetical protein CapIbe_012017 [Capra ibex]